MPIDEANQVTVAQVAASFMTAGIQPVGELAAIAKVVSGQLAVTRPAFSSTPFGTEPATFLAKLVEESR